MTHQPYIKDFYPCLYCGDKFNKSIDLQIHSVGCVALLKNEKTKYHAAVDDFLNPGTRPPRDATPYGAIVNGGVFISRIEQMNYECDDCFLNGSEEMEGLKECFKALSDYAERMGQHSGLMFDFLRHLAEMTCPASLGPETYARLKELIARGE